MTDPDTAQYLVAIDGEMTGPSLKHHRMVAMGACVVRVGAEPEVVDRFGAYMPIPSDGDAAWDPATWREFWDNPAKAATRTTYHPGKDGGRTTRKVNGTPVVFLRDAAHSVGVQQPAAAMEAFWLWLKRVTAGRNYTIVSDTAGYDVKWFDYYLSTYLDTPNETHALELVSGTYKPNRALTCHSIGAAGRPLWASSKGARDEALGEGVVLPEACLAVEHDHNPAHDAQAMGMKAAYLSHVLAERAAKVKCAQKEAEARKRLREASIGSDVDTDGDSNLVVAHEAGVCAIV